MRLCFAAGAEKILSELSYFEPFLTTRPTWGRRISGGTINLRRPFPSSALERALATSRRRSRFALEEITSGKGRYQKRFSLIFRGFRKSVFRAEQQRVRRVNVLRAISVLMRLLLRGAASGSESICQIASTAARGTRGSLLSQALTATSWRDYAFNVVRWTSGRVRKSTHLQVP